ncbi:MAG TPA: DUF2281 domain-containing protein [Pyrinomonadaceae bacterium]|jgi:hypothetical protein|nr:DUF2281 domain-containing protein [Pyrinomonadaceae bacterium]
MSSDQKSLEEIVRDLPPDSQAKVRQFVESLQAPANGEADRRLSQSWAGALSEYKEKYTSLELQKKSLEWRGD